jgi:hypothetical protein
MERDEMLKTLGFSDRFLQALEEFEKAVPNIYYEAPFHDVKENLTSIGDNGHLIIEHPNDKYNQNIIVRQASQFPTINL